MFRSSILNFPEEYGLPPHNAAVARAPLSDIGRPSKSAGTHRCEKSHWFLKEWKRELLEAAGLLSYHVSTAVGI